MKNKSFIGIDISKNVIDVSIFCEEAPIKDFSHDVFNNSRKGFGEMCTWLKKNHVVLSNCLFGMEFTGSYSMELEKFLNAKELSVLHALHPCGKALSHGAQGQERQD